jgi:hypothetical protein
LSLVSSAAGVTTACGAALTLCSDASLGVVADAVGTGGWAFSISVACSGADATGLVSEVFTTDSGGTVVDAISGAYGGDSLSFNGSLGIATGSLALGELPVGSGAGAGFPSIPDFRSPTFDAVELDRATVFSPPADDDTGVFCGAADALSVFSGLSSNIGVFERWDVTTMDEGCDAFVVGSASGFVVAGAVATIEVCPAPLSAIVPSVTFSSEFGCSAGALVSFPCNATVSAVLPGFIGCAS